MRNIFTNNMNLATPHKQKILILGAQGMLGQDLRHAFAEDEIVAWDREDCDITKSQEVFLRIQSVKPDVIINAAAYNLVDEAETPKGRIISENVNVLGPSNIAFVARSLGVPFLHYSTDYVFDGTEVQGYIENAPTNPQSVYAKSKCDGEKAVQAIGGSWYIIRTCKLFGRPAQSLAAKKSFVDTMRGLAQKHSRIEVVDDERGSPTYTSDLAAQTRLLISKKYPSGMYHITNSGHCTWYEFACEIFRQMHVSIDVVPVTADHFPRSAKRPHTSILLNTKLPMLRSWQEALAVYLSTT